MARHKHLDPQALEDLEEAERLFEPYLAYARLQEWRGLTPLAYGVWKLTYEESLESEGI